MLVFKRTCDMGKQIPELSYLLSEVEKHYGRRLATSTDFEALSVLIERETNDMLSSSTLKRMWGYVTKHPVPRVTTLDILSRYIGYKDFRAFCSSLKDSAEYESSFFSAKIVEVSALECGDRVHIGWNPNRLVLLEYLGDFRFWVVSNENSHLMEGDEFTITSFMLGYPLYIPTILRDGENTPSYIAGQASGLTVVDVE